MMHLQARVAYAEVGRVQVLELPYGDGAMSMVVLLPKRVGGLAALEADLSVSRVAMWLGALHRQTVKVFLPRFRLVGQVELGGTLRELGMASSFSDSAADFSAMMDQQPGLRISEVIHKAVVEVTEEGTEAGLVGTPPMAVLRPPAPCRGQ